MVIEICLFLFLTFLLYNLMNKDNKNYPPGPRCFPIIGNKPLMFDDEALEMSKKYGDIFMTKTGNMRIIYLADFDLTKSLFSKAEFSDRPNWEMFRAIKERSLCDEPLGLIFSNGERWQHSRRFVLKHLRNLGMGKSRMETSILREVEILIEEFKTYDGTPTKLPASINVAVLNIVWQLVASQRFDTNDKMVESVSSKIKKFQENHMFMLIWEFFPILKIIPAKIRHSMSGLDRYITSTMNSFNDGIVPFIREHQSTLDENNPRDLIDDYLIEMKKNTEGAARFFSQDDLLRTVFDLFAAGNDTTGNMIRWILLYMAKHQGIQKRVQEAIDEEVPRDTLPALEHRTRLPYVEAVINEVLRCATFVNYGLFHECTEDTTVKGYFIPKGSVMISLATLCHYDANYWEDPQKFDPDRFIDSNGKFVAHKSGEIAFGVGKRQCIGESLARMELYFLTAALLQNFSFAPLPGTEINLQPKRIPQINFPKEQKLIISLRK